jgi:hypothetical protein
VAELFRSNCSAGNAEALCRSSAGFIASSNKGNLGRRAGAICSMLGECRAHVSALSNQPCWFACISLPALHDAAVPCTVFNFTG